MLQDQAKSYIFSRLKYKPNFTSYEQVCLNVTLIFLRFSGKIFEKCLLCEGLQRCRDLRMFFEQTKLGQTQNINLKLFGDSIFALKLDGN